MSSTPSEDSTSSDDCKPTPPTSVSGDSEDNVEIICEMVNPTVSFLYQPHPSKRNHVMAKIETIHEFMEKSPAVLFTYWELFPQMCDHFLTLACGDDGLWHTLLATATIVGDMFRCQGPSQFYFVEKAKSLRLIQMAISTDAVDEALVAAVFMQMFCEFCTNNLDAVQHHLHGLYLLYQRCQQRQADSYGGLAYLRPITRFMGPMCFRADLTNAAMLEMPPQWPVMTPLDEIEDRKWLVKLARVSKGMPRESIEWALASFEVDNLWQRTYRFAMQSSKYRKSGDPQAEEKIALEYLKLRTSFKVWQLRSIVVQQEAIERYASDLPNPPADQYHRFLSHQPAYPKNHFYAKVLNQWRAVWIYASTIAQPITGPRADIPERFQFAVEICRTHAALGRDGLNGPQWWCLFYAGLAFGAKQYPLECHWIMERLTEIAIEFPVLRVPFSYMPATWAAERVHWNAWGRLFPIPRED